MGLSPLTRIVTNLERHLLSLSNRDFAARSHPALANGLENLVVGEFVTRLERHSVDDVTTMLDDGQPGIDAAKWLDGGRLSLSSI